MFPRAHQSSKNNPILRAEKKILENREFASLRTDEDRVKFAAKALIKNSRVLWPEKDSPSEYKKNSSESDQFRNAGNTAFNSRSGQPGAALRLYSKSIRYALPGSTQLSLGYANRSAVFFKKNYFEECLMDIDRALEIGYPDDLKPKLLIRKFTCNYALTGDANFETDETLMQARSLVEKLPVSNKMKQMVEDIIKNPEKTTSIKREDRQPWGTFVPEIEGQNPLLPEASDAIALKYSEEFGRHVMATRDIKPGEVLVVIKPYVTTIEPAVNFYICSHCGKRAWNNIPCDHCVLVMYCSDECRRAAWSGYHDIECHVLESMMTLQMRYYPLQSMKMTIKAVKEAGGLENLEKRLKELHRLTGAEIDSPINPNSFETVHTTPDNCSHKTPQEMLQWSLWAVKVTYNLATKTEFLGEKFEANLDIIRNSKWFPFVAALILKYIRIARNLTNGICSNEGGGKQGVLASAILPLYNFFNHRCYEGVEFVPFSNTMALISHYPIKKGQQVFMNRGIDFKKFSKEFRMMALKEQEGLAARCNCLACKRNWSNSSLTSYEDQNLPKETKDELRMRIAMLRIIRSPDSLKTETNFEDCRKLERYFCEAMELMYPLVKKPCTEVEEVSNGLMLVHDKLGFPYVPFDKQL